MASSRTSRSNRAKTLRIGSFIVIAVVAVGSSFAVASTDLAYGSQSLLAAAFSAFSSSPGVMITRNAKSPSGKIVPNAVRVLGIFDVAPRNMTSDAYLTNVRADVTVNTTAQGLKLMQFSMQYGYCLSTGCNTMNIPIVSSSQSGITYKLVSSQVSLPVYANQISSILSVSGYPYYTTASSVRAKTSSVKVDIGTVLATGTLCKTVRYGYKNAYGYSKCGVAAISVNTNLAYGRWLDVLRGYGYGYISTTPPVPTTPTPVPTVAADVTPVLGVPTTAVTTGAIGSGDTGTFTIPFTIMAGNNDVFISAAPTFAKTLTSTANATGPAVSNFTASNTVVGDVAGSYYIVLAGTSRIFTLTVAYTATTTGFTGVMLTGIPYGLSSGPFTSVYTANLGSFKTSDISLVKH